MLRKDFKNLESLITQLRNAVEMFKSIGVQSDGIADSIYLQALVQI